MVGDLFDSPVKILIVPVVIILLIVVIIVRTYAQPGTPVTAPGMPVTAQSQELVVDMPRGEAGRR